MRRIHVPTLAPGDVPVPDDQSHHVRHVLRLPDGAEVELFDNTGRTARATLLYPTATQTLARVTTVTDPPANQRSITVASAIPKGDRAEWMIEKLSELGVAAFIPLRTRRSVVHPEGANKLDRWRRIATESAKQSKRPGVMEIRDLTDLPALLSTKLSGWYFSTAPDATPAKDLLTRLAPDTLTLLIGPEGGWTDDELAAMSAAGLTAVSLGPTILRVETAAVAATVVASMA